jgi:hypothetical protein
MSVAARCERVNTDEQCVSFESIATLLPFVPIEGQKWIDQISSQCDSQKNRFAFISFGNLLRRYDMSGRSQMQGGKNWILPRDQGKPVLPRLSLAGNLDKPLMSLYGTEWRERGHGLRLCRTQRSYRLWQK